MRFMSSAITAKKSRLSSGGAPLSPWNEPCPSLSEPIEGLLALNARRFGFSGVFSHDWPDSSVVI